MQEGRGHSFTPNVAPDPGDLLLLLSPGHLVSGHHRTVDNSGGGQGEGRLGVAATDGLVRVAGVLVRISLTLLLVDSVVPGDLERDSVNVSLVSVSSNLYLVVVDDMSQGSHPGSRALVLVPLIVFLAPARFVLDVTERSGPGTPLTVSL